MWGPGPRQSSEALKGCRPQDGKGHWPLEPEQEGRPGANLGENGSPQLSAFEALGRLGGERLQRQLHRCRCPGRAERSDRHCNEDTLQLWVFFADTVYLVWLRANLGLGPKGQGLSGLRLDPCALEHHHEKGIMLAPALWATVSPLMH